MKINKIFIFYSLFLIVFLSIFFFDLKKEDFLFFLDFMDKLKEKSLIILIFFLILISILVSLIGFCIPVLFINGMILGGIWGAFISLISLTTGSYIFFLFNNKNFSKKILKPYQNKFKTLRKFITKNLLLSLIFIRAFGFGLPFIAHNLLPIFLKANKKTFLLSTFIGLIPLTAQSFFADGITNFFISENNDIKSFFFQKDIIVPIIIIFVTIILSIFFKHKFLKK